MSTMMQLDPCLHYSYGDILAVAGAKLNSCDGSVAVLKSIFGQPISYMTDVANMGDASVHSLVTRFIGYFNYSFVAILMLIYGYVVIISVVNTQSEGRLGGKLMANAWFPFRLLIPPGLLLPVKGVGFCFLQYLIMYTVLVGVNMANFVWQSAVNSIDLGYLPTTPQALTTGVANDIGDVFVYDAVKNILDGIDQAAGGKTVSVPVSGGTGKVVGTPYQQQVVAHLDQTCESAVDPKTCKAGVAAMFANDMTAITYPAAPGAKQGSDFGAKTNYYQYRIAYGSKPDFFDGHYEASGFYVFNLDGPLTPPADTNKSVNTQNIIAWLNGQSSMGLGPYSNIMRWVSNPGGGPSIICTDGSICSFSSIVNAVMQKMITQNPPDLKANQIVVQGTGQTCDNICRGPNYLPYPGWDHDSNSCPSPYKMQTDNQCYKTVRDSTGQAARGVAIPSQYLANSWWYGSRVYLQLNEQMSDNIKQLAGDIKDFEIDPQNVLKIAQFEPSGNNKTGVLTYAYIEQVAYDQTGKNITGSGTMLGPDNPQSTGEISLVPSPGTKAANFAWPQWSDMICSYATSLPMGMTPQTCTEQLQARETTPLPGQVTTLGGSTANALGLQSVSTGEDSEFYNTLVNLPVKYQPPVGVLIKLNKAGFISLPDLKNYVNNIISILQINHVYPGSQLAPTGDTGVADADEVNPVNYWIGSMFNRMMGVNVPGLGGAGTTGGLFKDIYALGNTDMDSVDEIFSGSFNTLAQAQRIGLEMIDTVTLSLQNVYQHFKVKLASFRKKDRSIALGGGAGALSSELVLGAIGVPYSGSVSTAIAVATQTALQFTLADQMHEIAEDMLWFPLLFVVLTSLFTAGVSFAILLPLVPYILFWAGQIAWLMAVIEAMIAAPIVVLGMMTPGGHEHFGHIVPGFRMWISLVFRPVLMVMGLLIGLVLTYIVVRFSSQGFQLIATQIINFAGNTDNYGVTSLAQQGYANNVSLTQGIVACILLTTFCGFMVLAFNKCFAAIYLVPEKVMQWVGGMADKAGEQELNQMTSAMGQTASSGAQAGGQAMDKGGQAESQYGQQSGSADAQAMSGGIQLAHQVTRESQMQGQGSKEGEGGSVGSGGDE